MTKKRFSEKAKEASEEAILSALLNKSPQRWSELLQNVNLSSRTLKKALERMIEKNDVYRYVETGRGYPPPVFYGVTPKGQDKMTPIIFAIQAAHYVSGFDLEWQKPQKTDIGPRLIVDPKTRFEEKTPEQRLNEIGKRVGALYLYELVKSMGEEGEDWPVNASSNFLNPQLFLLQFMDILPDIKQQCQERITMNTELIPLDNEHVVFEFPQFLSLSKEDSQRLLDLLRKTYPKEMESFEMILKQI